MLTPLFRKPAILAFVLAVTLLCAPIALAQMPDGNPLTGLAQLKVGETMRASSCDPDLANGNGDARPIAPGKTLVLAELAGPGVINHFWNTIAADEHGYSRLLVLRMYWDGEEQPSVECPIGDFFGIGHGVDQPFDSLPVIVTSEGRARNCYWPMPFGKSAKVTVTNEGARPVHAFYYYLDWQQLPSLPADTAYFHAMYRQEFPAVMGKNYLIADIEGRGHFVGTVLSVRQRTASWWGEGDDFWFIDGETEPRLRGTGSEDYFCDAWGLRQMATPYYGAPLMQGYDPFDLTTCYRWHITDPVSFQKSLRLEIEHKGVTFKEDGEVQSGFEERPDDFASVGFWYQTEPHKAYPSLPAAYDRLFYDWKAVKEAEAMLEAAKMTAGAVERQEGGWSGGAQLFWPVLDCNQSLELPIEIPKDGEYEIVLLLTKSWDYGIYQVLLDDAPLGVPVDLCSPTIATEEKHLSSGKVKAGMHTLRFENKGKSAESQGCFFGLDGILLNPQK